MIIPWCVDVPQERRPVVNWLIIAATVGIFYFQVVDATQAPNARPQVRPPARNGLSAPADGDVADANTPASLERREAVPPGITGRFMLNGWGLRGLFGYMWLHGSVLHLLGNMLFLWIFGNAVCAKIGNLRYFGLYILLGVAAGLAHLLVASGTVIGASGAINGVVGMYLVLFPENDITCYWVPIIVYWRQFIMSSYKMVLFWLFWDILGAVVLAKGGGVAYFAHLGGFGAGFGIAYLMCANGWITMERYEKSLLQMWQERKARKRGKAFDSTYAQLGLSPSDVESPSEPTVAEPPPRTAPFLDLEGKPNPVSAGFLRVTCPCGKPLRASHQYAGKTVLCPTCKARLTLPRDEAPAVAGPLRSHDAPIRFTCSCGQAIKVPARHAGRAGKCPHCGARVKIPEPQ